MKLSTRFITMILCLLLTVPLVLSSCDDPIGNNSEDKSKSESETSDQDLNNDHGGYNKETKTYFVNMPENPNPDQKEFTVLVYDNTEQATYFSEEVGVDKYETTDEQLEEAVRNRNNKVLEDYGVEIKAAYVKNVKEDLSTDVTSGIGAYDAAMPFLVSCASLAQSNALLDLAGEDFENYIDLDMPWWDTNATDSLSIGNKVFFTTGDISIMQKIVSVAVTFNKDMFAEANPNEDLYQIVKDGEWTLDKMIEFSKMVTKDENGDSIYTYDDKWGLSASYNDAAMYYLASGEHFVSKDEEDKPTIAIGKDRSINVSQAILEKLQLSNQWVIHAEKFNLSGGEMWKKSLDIFGENRALFRTSAFSAIKKLRNYKDNADFGLVPVPKFNAEQDSYNTPCSASLAYGIVIPTSAKNPEFSAYMIEVMACEAKNYITSAYYDTILKSRDMKDNDSEDMLDDFIFNNVVYDLGIIYDFGQVSSMFKKLMEDNSDDITSTLESKKAGIQTAIDDVILAYAD